MQVPTLRLPYHTEGAGQADGHNFTLSSGLNQNQLGCDENVDSPALYMQQPDKKVYGFMHMDNFD